MKDTIKIEKIGVRMVAHRGLSKLEKENTNTAFVAAANRSYWGIETDVHVTADGKFILIHDDTTDRVCGVSYTVEQTDFETLRSIPILDTDGGAGRVDLRMPTPEEYLKICLDYGKVSVLELKNAFEEKDIHAIVDLIEACGCFENVVFISFHLNNLLVLRAYRPDANVQFLNGKHTAEELIAIAKEHHIDFDLNHAKVTPELVDALHALGSKVNVWTVDSPEAASRMIDCGVDFITSNILE